MNSLLNAGRKLGTAVFFATTLAFVASKEARGQSYSWTGGGADNNWNTAANWGGTAPSGSGLDLTFSGTTRTTNTNNISSLNITYLNFTNTGAGESFALSGNSLAFSNNSIISTAAPSGAITTTIANNLSFGVAGNNSFLKPDSSVVGGSTFNHNLTLSGQISGAGNLWKQQAGTLTLTGNSTSTFTGNFYIEGGTAIVTGSTGKLTGVNQTWIGNNSTNSNLQVSSGGVYSTSTTYLGVGSTSASNSLTVTGATGVTTSFTQSSSSGYLALGYEGQSNSMTVQSGATVTNSGVAYIGYAATSTGNTVAVTGSGSTWTSNNTFYNGFNGGNNQIQITNGGKITVGSTADALFGQNSGSNSNSMTVSGSGSEFKVSGTRTLYVGKTGNTNSITVQNGATLTTYGTRLGDLSASSGNSITVTGSGSTWNNGNTLGGTIRVGSDGSGNSLTISNGGVVNSTGNVFVGYLNSTSAANNVLTVTGSGSVLNVGTSLVTGSDLVIGATAGAGNKAVVADSGSISARHNVEIGPKGTLQIGTGGATGSVSAAAINGQTSGSFPNDKATVEFNHNSSAGLTVSTAMTGVLSVNNLGTGTTILTGSKTYTGTTTVNGGDLRVNGTLATGNVVTVGAGGTLSGSGTIGGNTNISGTHNPGATVGNQTFNSNLTYNVGSIVNWQLTANTNSDGTKYDKVTVSGNLTYSGRTALGLSFDSLGSNVDWSDSFWSVDRSWTIYQVSGTTTGVPNLSVVYSSWNDGQGDSLASVRQYAGFWTSQVGNNVVLNYSVVMPEPASIVLAGVGLGGLAIKRLRRRECRPEAS